MATRTARVKQHTRTSKNGKVHKVRQHGRQVSMADMLKNAFVNPSTKKIAWGAVGTTSFTGLIWGLSTAMSAMAAVIWAIILACMAIVFMLLATKQQRREKAKAFRKSAALKVERRMKLWAHHNVTDRKAQPKAEPKAEYKAEPKAEKKAAPKKTNTTNDRPQPVQKKKEPAMAATEPKSAWEEIREELKGKPSYKSAWQNIEPKERGSM